MDAAETCGLFDGQPLWWKLLGDQGLLAVPAVLCMRVRTMISDFSVRVGCGIYSCQEDLVVFPAESGSDFG